MVHETGEELDFPFYHRKSLAQRAAREEQKLKNYFLVLSKIRS